MTKSTVSVGRVHLHVTPSGELWAAEDGGAPRPAAGGLPGFLERPAVPKGAVVRVSGEAGNADLILRLWACREAGVVRDVQVCSPLAVSSVKRRGHPESAFADLQAWSARPSCGGWRTVEPADVDAYRLAVAAARGERLAPHLARHPARFAVETASLDGERAAALLAALVDPRFYIDPADPDRFSKMESFLGLNPDTASGAAPGGRHRQRYDLVTAAWKHSRPSAEDASRTPGLFLWDVFYRRGANWQAELKAGQTLIRYLRHLWLDELYRGRVAEGLFVATHFFDKDSNRVRWFEAARSNFSAASGSGRAA